MVPSRSRQLTWPVFIRFHSSRRNSPIWHEIGPLLRLSLRPVEPKSLGLQGFIFLMAGVPPDVGPRDAPGERVVGERVVGARGAARVVGARGAARVVGARGAGRGAGAAS